MTFRHPQHRRRPVTAMALHRAGIDSFFYEAYGRGSDGVGAFLTLAVNGWKHSTSSI